MLSAHAHALRSKWRRRAARVKATAASANTAAMPFSAGNHIPFRTPMGPGGAPSALTLQTPSTIEHKKLDGAPTGEKVPRSLAQPVALKDFDARVAVSLGTKDLATARARRDAFLTHLHLEQALGSVQPRLAA